MSLLFHPARPSLLVGGSFNGEIFLWDISKKDDSLISSSTMDEYFHRESITQMIWVEQQNSLPINTLNSQYNLISLSTDGKMLFWNMKYEEKGDGSLLNYPIKGYSLLRKKEGFISNVGGLCFSHSCEDKDTFIIGTEAGSILRAVVANISFEKKQKVLFEQKSEIAKNLKWKEESLPVMVNLNQKVIPEIKMFVEEYAKNNGIQEILPKHIFASKPDLRKIYPNPVTSAFEPHMGPVYSVHFSPFHRNVFISSSLDGSVRLYDLLQVIKIAEFLVFLFNLDKITYAF
jgi:WD40 repeat protein